MTPSTNRRSNLAIKLLPVLIALMILALHALASTRSEESGKGGHAPPTTQRQEVVVEPTAAQSDGEAKLEIRIDQVNFANVSLSTVLESIAEVAGVPLEVRWDLLGDAGVKRDDRVTARLRGVRAFRAMSSVLSEAGHGDVDLKCYVDARGRAIVTTRADYNRGHTAKREYDVLDLLGTDKNAWPERSPANQRLIEETIDPTWWADCGGDKTFTIRFEAGRMIVVNTLENQRGVQNLLDQLRETRAGG